MFLMFLMLFGSSLQKLSADVSVEKRLVNVLDESAELF